MSRPQGEIAPDTQVKHLIEVVVRHRDERCAKLREQAHVKAKILLQKAHAQARARMHEHIVAMREKNRLRIAAASARNKTLARLQQQQASQAMLDQARQPLHDALLARWRNETARRLWLDALLHVAARTLLLRDWRIEHPADWPQSEHEELLQRLQTLGVSEPAFTPYDDIEAGLRIIARGATIDATLIGLLQHKTAIESVLMARLMPLLTHNHSITDSGDRG